MKLRNFVSASMHALLIDRGGVAMYVFVVCAFIAIGASGYLKLTSASLAATRTQIHYEKARVAAQSALDHAVVEVRQEIYEVGRLSRSKSQLQQDLDLRFQNGGAITNIGGYTIESCDGSAGVGVSVEDEPRRSSKIGAGTFRGLMGDCQRITVNARARHPGSELSVGFRQTIMIASIAYLRYCIFYEDTLELHPGPVMHVRGPVHCNGDIWVRGGSGLYFHDSITAAGGLLAGYYFTKKKCTVGQADKIGIEDDTGALMDMSADGHILDSELDDWASLAPDRWGDQLKTADHGVSLVTSPLGEQETDSHALIERPLSPQSESYSEVTEHQKFANKAALRICLLNDGSVRVHDSNGFLISEVEPAEMAEVATTGTGTNGIEKKSSTGQYELAQRGWCGVSDSFYDCRELDDIVERVSNGGGTGGGYPWADDRQMYALDIYLDEFVEEFSDYLDSPFDEDTGSRDGLIYVTAEAPAQDAPMRGAKPAIRLRNGANIGGVATHGMTVATDLGMYVEGDFNTENKTLALLASDNITLLSNGWRDSNSKKSGPYRVAASTTLNAALMTGYADPDNGDYATAGAHNLVRFLEKWTSKDYNFTGSLLSMWTAQESACIWSCNSSRFSYTPPRRNLNYDDAFRTGSPPGMPCGFAFDVLVWEELCHGDAENDS